MKINELNININKAVITSVELKLSDEGLVIDVSGGLFTKQGKRVSGFNFTTNHWNEDESLPLPFSLHEPARKIFEILTPVIYTQIEGEFKLLSSNIDKSVPLSEDTPNPNDIPF